MIKILSSAFAAICLMSHLAWSQTSEEEITWGDEDAVAAFESCYAAAFETKGLNQCGYSKGCMDYSIGGTSTMGMRNCFNREAELWDIKLNKEYKILMAAARRHDENMPDAFRWDGFSRAASLLKAQRAWLDYRDAECEDVYWSAHPGSIKQVRTSRCKQNLVKERTIKIRVENEYENRR